MRSSAVFIATSRRPGSRSPPCHYGPRPVGAEPGRVATSIAGPNNFPFIPAKPGRPMRRPTMRTGNTITRRLDDQRLRLSAARHAPSHPHRATASPSAQLARFSEPTTPPIRSSAVFSATSRRPGLLPQPFRCSRAVRPAQHRDSPRLHDDEFIHHVMPLDGPPRTMTGKGDQRIAPPHKVDSPGPFRPHHWQIAKESHTEE
jgi:hypothetical protein